MHLKLLFLMVCAIVFLPVFSNAAEPLFSFGGKTGLQYNRFTDLAIKMIDLIGEDQPHYSWTGGLHVSVNTPPVMRFTTEFNYRRKGGSYFLILESVNRDLDLHYLEVPVLAEFIADLGYIRSMPYTGISSAWLLQANTSFMGTRHDETDSMKTWEPGWIIGIKNYWNNLFIDLRFTSSFFPFSKSELQIRHRSFTAEMGWELQPVSGDMLRHHDMKPFAGFLNISYPLLFGWQTRIGVHGALGIAIRRNTLSVGSTFYMSEPIDTTYLEGSSIHYPYIEKFLLHLCLNYGYTIPIIKCMELQPNISIGYTEYYDVFRRLYIYGNGEIHMVGMAADTPESPYVPVGIGLKSLLGSGPVKLSVEYKIHMGRDKAAHLFLIGVELQKWFGSPRQR